MNTTDRSKETRTFRAGVERFVAVGMGQSDHSFDPRVDLGTERHEIDWLGQ